MDGISSTRGDNDSLESHDDMFGGDEDPAAPSDSNDSIHSVSEPLSDDISSSKKKVRKYRKKMVNMSLFPDMPLRINDDVPQYRDLQEERGYLMSYLDTLLMRTGRQPIWLIEHKNCFTNTAMRLTLSKILGGKKNFQKYVVRYTIDPSVYEYPIPEPDTIFILGGSVNDTYDRFGHDFTSRFSLPLLDEVVQSNRIRVLGICFGHQSLIEAYGRLVNVPIKTIKDDIQFGIYEVNFLDSHPGLSYLASSVPRGVAFTRSGYPRRFDDASASSIPGMNVIAEFSGQLKYTDSEKDRSFVPQGVSYMKNQHTNNDMVVSFQGHPEIQSTRDHIVPITQYIESMRDKMAHIIQPVLPLEIPQGKRPLMIADAFFIPLLKQFADELVHY